MSKSYQKHVWVNKGKPPISASNLNEMEQGIGDGIDLGNDNEKAINDHLDDTTNPHHVTAAQVGLGNVNNTSDLDKPVSTATQKAIDAEVSRAKGIENGLDKRIAANAEAINTESDRAKKAEQEFNNSLNKEVDRAKQAESAASKAASDEATRAKGVESGLDTRVKETEKYVSGAIKITHDSENYICIEYAEGQ